MNNKLLTDRSLKKSQQANVHIDRRGLRRDDTRLRRAWTWSAV